MLGLGLLSLGARCEIIRCHQRLKGVRGALCLPEDGLPVVWE